MRLVVGLLALTLTSSLALADDAKPPQAQPEPTRARIDWRVVSVLPDSHQALLLDKRHGTHVLAEVGSTVGAYRVDAIEDDEVILTTGNREVVLAGPTARRQARPAPAPAPAGEPADPYAATPSTPAGPIDPYEAAAAGPVDPYAEPAAAPLGPVRVVEAPTPITAGDDGVRVVEAPASGTTTPASNSPLPVTTIEDPPSAPLPVITVLPPAAPLPEPAVPAAIPSAIPAPLDAPATAPTITLARADVTAALSDFGALMAGIRGAFTPAGARVDHVASGSVFAKAGLRKGDVVTAVDGEPMREIDDAAELYIRASTLRAAKVQLVRDGKPITLHLAIP